MSSLFMVRKIFPGRASCNLICKSVETSILFPSDPDKISEKDLLHLLPFSTYNSSTSRHRELWAIVAMNHENAIGRDGDLPWRIPEDMRHFRELTMGHPVIMGRKTWESIPKRPLPGRRNIVVSRNPDYRAEGAEVFSSLEEAVDACRETPFIIGGAQIYEKAVPFCSKIFITSVDASAVDADAFFPPLPQSEWLVTDESEQFISKSGIGYRFLTKIRR